MITVNGLLIAALKAIGVESEWDPNDGQTTNAALADINSLITELNLEDLLIENRKEEFVSGADKITIGDGEQFTINTKFIPSTIKSVSRKIGNRYMKLINTDKQTIFSTNRKSLSTLYNYNIAYDEEARTMVGTIFMDSDLPREYLVIYNKPIPLVTMADEIPLSDMSTNLLEEGLKFKLARRYKLPDVNDFESDFNDYKNLVRQNIANNRSLIMDNLIDSSYLDPYYNLIGGVGF